MGSVLSLDLDQGMDLLLDWDLDLGSCWILEIMSVYARDLLMGGQYCLWIWNFGKMIRGKMKGREIY